MNDLIGYYRELPEHKCPVCKRKHRRPVPFCSVACALKSREGVSPHETAPRLQKPAEAIVTCVCGRVSCNRVH